MKIENDNTIITCTCDIYKLIQCAAHQQVPIDPDNEESFPDNTLTCMHCQFYKDFLLNAYERLLQQNTCLTQALNKVQESLQYMNYPVQLLGNVLSHATTKFSVQGDSTYSIITFNFHQGNCFAKCTHGICCAQMLNRKKIPKKVTIEHSDKICSHLNTIYKNFDYVKGFFPVYFCSEDVSLENEEEEHSPTVNVRTEDINTDDANLQIELSPNFDEETGMWDFKALSKHIPHTNMLDVNLIANTQERNDIVISTNFDTTYGVYRNAELKPHPLQENCQCGAMYENGDYSYKGSTTLYTRNGPVDLKLYNVKCHACQHETTFLDEAATKGIFFYSNKTCAGDEIGWDFVSMVQKTKVSFTGFCLEMTRRYKMNSINCANFMSPNTFVKWFFSWISAFQIDFRKHVNPWCQHTPKVLACDGTHIGVSARNLNLTSPATRVDDIDHTSITKHKRYDRVFVANKDARLHLNYLCRKIINKLKPNEHLEETEEIQQTQKTFEIVTTLGDDVLTHTVRALIDQTLHNKVITTLAKLFVMLCKDAPFSSVAPFRSHPIIHQCIRDVQLHQILPSKITELKKYCVEMADFLVACVEHRSPNFGSAFCEHLVLKIEIVHQCNHPVQQPQEIHNSYYPPGGTAYYFSETGKQVCVCVTVCVYVSMLSICKLPFVDPNVYFESVFVDQQNAIL